LELPIRDSGPKEGKGLGKGKFTPVMSGAKKIDFSKRFRPGQRALKEIKEMQKKIEPVLPRLPF
jgi:hypothetical protein